MPDGRPVTGVVAATPARKRLDLDNYGRGVPWSTGSRASTVVSLCRDIGPIDRLCDIGCGDGVFSQILGEVSGASEVAGVDLFPQAVDAARARGVNCARLDLDTDDLPFPPDTFDLVFCGEVIEHLFDPDHLLDEVFRVLQPGAVAIITTPNLASWYNRLLLLLGYQPYRTSASLRWGGVGKLARGLVELHQADHIRVMTSRTLRELLSLHGFRVQRLVGYHEAGGLKSSFLARLLGWPERGLARFPSLSSGVIAVARKERSPAPHGAPEDDEVRR